MGKPPAKKSELNVANDGQKDPFAAEVAKRVGALVGKDQRDQIVAQIVSLVMEEKFSGPIAHPKHLREYEDILPGSADRIITMAEDTLKHQKGMQEQALLADIEDQRSGRRYGFAALLVLLICALITGLQGHAVLAGAFLTTAALGTVGSFINGKLKQD